MDHTNWHQAVTVDLMMMVKETTASETKYTNSMKPLLSVRSTHGARQHIGVQCRGNDAQTHILVRPMWEHRRLVVVHAFIRKVVIDYLDKLYKLLSRTEHAFVTWMGGNTMHELGVLLQLLLHNVVCTLLYINILLIEVRYLWWGWEFWTFNLQVKQRANKIV